MRGPKARKLSSNLIVNVKVAKYMELLIRRVLLYSVYSTLSMCNNYALTWGSGSMPLGKFLKNKCNEIESRDNCNFKMIAILLAISQ